MSHQSGRALNNVLLRWVQRHQSMTTLFHSHPHPVHSTQAMQMPQQPEATTVIQAKPVDTQAPTQPDLPIAQSSPKVTEVRQVNPSLPVASPVKEAKMPTSPTPATSTQPDQGWKRLQTIFRKHQEQENPTVESIKSPQHPLETNPHIERTSEPPEPSKISSNTQQSETPEVRQPAQTPHVIERKPDPAVAQNVSIEHATVKPENKVQAPETHSSDIDQPAAASLPETSKTVINQETSQPNSKIVSPGEFPISVEEPGIEEEPKQLNALPLEAVWNVQRTEESEPTEQPMSRPTRLHHTPADSALPKPVLQRSELESDVSSSGFQNESSMDTDVTSEMRAPVEILAPSRPRPAPVNPVTPSAVIQKQPQDQQAASPEAREDRLIETAIGPLPADLWQLIGQKPPESKPQLPTHETMSASIPQQTESAKPQEEVIGHERTSQPAKPIKMVDFPAAVQRQPVAADASSSEQPRDVSISSSQQIAEPELDVDELARKVYARIRQRLSTEWERLRRK
jgi:hypothetical protein